MNIVRTLHRTPYRYTVVGVRYGNRSVILNVKLLLRAGFVFAFDDEVSFGPNIVDIAFVDEKLFEDIVVAPNDFFQRQ